VRSIQELIALAKAKSGQLYYSAAGVGTNPHIAGDSSTLLADVNIVAVQFKGGAPADQALIAGDVAVTFGNISQEIGHAKAGRMRALAVTSVPGYEFDTWFVVAAPKGRRARLWTR